ncbi:MAG: universal stress protein UspA [Acidobacteria bacterium RIFCSPLOWO2_12_FULL_60_22]|nr:MAG: universal stress protein UspA [Acidobacteria bacterium RIFCSPLOWO2_12_FULL_60_22]
MTTPALLATAPIAKTALYGRILVALDSSDHANSGMDAAVRLAGIGDDGRITGVHVYAAKLHDVRFRQMEGGLPEKFREERELERQRDVHDDLITRGLSIITDSYLDQAERGCRKAGINFNRRALEGKNYHELAREANSGAYDLLVMGALGLGAVEGTRLGSVCQRVARRSSIDTLVIKDSTRDLAEGPIVAAVDGSAKAYGGLVTALALARHWDVPLKVVAAFDPYFHYVAFNRIAGVLSEEAGKVFRFKEQEKLHEEIIDSGLAKIYQGHLAVAQTIAKENGMTIETELLDGKPHDAIAKYLSRVIPSLLILGKLGIHADPELDIGGNAELLLQEAKCAVLLSQREHQPHVERLAEITTSWTREAEQRMQGVPSFVRNMARMAILRYAQERGHTVITENLVEEATANLMPGHAERAMSEIVAAHDAGELKPGSPQSFTPMRWSEGASALLRTVDDLALRGNLSMRAEKKARAEGSATVEREHIATFIDAPVTDTGRPATGDPQPRASLHWQAAALARLARVPEGPMRDACRQRIEDYARARGHGEITLSVAEAGLVEARKAMEVMMGGNAKSGPAAAAGGREASRCPFAGAANPTAKGLAKEGTQPGANEAVPPAWSSAARERLSAVPAGYCRDMTEKAAMTIAAQNGLAEIDTAFVEKILNVFQAGSAKTSESMPWEPAARERIERAPDIVRGMLVREIEGWARRNGKERVTGEAVDAAKRLWQERGMFHLDPDDPRSGEQEKSS